MPDSGSSGDTVQRTEPPSYAKPYIIGDPKQNIPGVLPESLRLYESEKPAYFPGSTIAPLAPETQTAFTAGANRALAGSPLNAAASGEVMSTLAGDYLGEGNPYLEGIRSLGEREASRIAGNLTGGGEHAMKSAIAEGYGHAVAPYMFNAYEAERGRMGDAARFAPTLAATDYQDIDYLRNIGGLRQAQGQAELGDEVARWDFSQNIDQQKLDNLIRAVYGVPGGTTYTSGGGGPSGLQQGLGTAMSMAGLAAMFMSDRNVKERIEPADTKSVTEKLIDLPISEWSYIDDQTRHLGPMAQDFQEAFGVGDGKTIHMADVAGVLLSAAKEQARGFMGPRRTA